ncbi:MAG: hypothetical protein ACAI44_19415 [Candidatus Sericytochromatia bacterium]
MITFLSLIGGLAAGVIAFRAGYAQGKRHGWQTGFMDGKAWRQEWEVTK